MIAIFSVFFRILSPDEALVYQYSDGLKLQLKYYSELLYKGILGYGIWNIYINDEIFV